MEESNDLNDAFDSIVMVEDRFRLHGFNDGFREGHEAGKDEGFQLGSEQGAKIGMEIGFYSGFVSTWMKLLSEESIRNQLHLSDKAVLSVEKFSKLLDSFSVDHHKTLDAQDMNNLRAKFKQVASLLNMSPSIDNSLSKWMSF